MEPEVPELPTSTQGKAEADCPVGLPSVSATQRGSDVISAASKSGSQEPLSLRSPMSTPLATLDIAHDTSPVPSRRQNLRTYTPDLQDSLISESLKELFSRASNIIQECIEVDGAIFLDASISTLGGQRRESPMTFAYFKL
jgi:hypothetical protein